MYTFSKSDNCSTTAAVFEPKEHKRGDRLSPTSQDYIENEAAIPSGSNSMVKKNTLPLMICECACTKTVSITIILHDCGRKQGHRHTGHIPVPKLGRAIAHGKKHTCYKVQKDNFFLLCMYSWVFLSISAGRTCAQ